MPAWRQCHAAARARARRHRMLDDDTTSAPRHVTMTIIASPSPPGRKFTKQYACRQPRHAWSSIKRYTSFRCDGRAADTAGQGVDYDGDTARDRCLSADGHAPAFTSLSVAVAVPEGKASRHRCRPPCREKYFRSLHTILAEYADSGRNDTRVIPHHRDKTTHGVVA